MRKVIQIHVPLVFSQHVFAARPGNTFLPTIDGHPFLCLEFFDAVVHLTRHKSERNDPGHVHFRAEDVHVEIQLFTHSLDVLETFLVIGTGATDPDLDFVLVE
jgi:hypothetical protein